MSHKDLNYKPSIEREIPRVSGDIKTTVKSLDSKPEVDTPPAEAKLGIISQVDSALEIDKKLNSLRGEIEQQSLNLELSIDPSERPLLAQAIAKLSDESQNSTIDYQMYDKSLRILSNGFVAQYGFDPGQLLHGNTSEEGIKVPKVNFPSTMTCNDVANLDLSALQGDTQDTQSIESILEQRQKNMQWNLLTILWRLILSFVFRFVARTIEKTRLNKVPIVGGPVRRFIRKMYRIAEKLQRWAQTGDAFRFTEENNTLDNDEKDILFVSGALEPDSSATDCISAASRVIKYVTNWASYTAEPEDTDVAPSPKAILMRQVLDREQTGHEANKFNIRLLAKEYDDLSEEVEKMLDNSKKIPYIANRFINRSIVN